MKTIGITAFLKRLVMRLAQADIVFYLMPLIMLNLVAGTVTQRELGLYAAQEMFFSTFITWIGPVTLPGGYLLTGALTLCLMLKFLLASEWRWAKSGIILTHLGVLILLVGGLLTSLSAKEGFMLLAEGDESPFVYDYHHRQLFVFENETLLRALDFDHAKPGTQKPGLPFELTFLSGCENCNIIERAKAQDQTATYQGMARFMALTPKPVQKEPEENIGGLSFTISGTQNDQDGSYIAFEGMPKPIEIKHGNKNYKIIFGREQRALPFKIRLKDFVKDTHPGTTMASGYHSDVIVKDGAVEWPVRIEMNKPLRYKGYTFYQSSFGEGPSGEMSVLSVVENKGRIFPYLGTFILALGLLLHLGLMAREKRTS
jgi:hypothetical protein